MEIITIPLSGALRHGDSMGNEDQVIRPGDIQVMSAGTGIVHHEFNASDAEPVSLLQIWIEPNEMGVRPRYGQQEFGSINGLTEIVSPLGSTSKSLQIHQDAHLFLGKLEAGQTEAYALRDPDHVTYLFVIEGEMEVAGQLLRKRDALGIVEADKIEILARQPSYYLLMELPLEVNKEMA
jgi:quercetin 2,3-dioxygenase